MRRVMVLLAVLAAILLSTSAFDVLAGSNARRPAIIKGTDRLVTLQRTNAGWEGTWFWTVGSNYNATNLTGVTALGLIETFNDAKDQRYLEAAVKAAGFIQTHLGAGATGPKYHVRTTLPDIIFLHQLGKVTGNSAYGARANLEWNNIKTSYPTAASVDAYFRKIQRRSAWDIAFFLEAAHLSGDQAWADDAAAILANVDDPFYYGNDTWWYALNLSGTVRALVGCGYYQQNSSQVTSLLDQLIALVDSNNGIDGYVQDTAYAILALNTVGGAARSYANSLGRWLSTQQSKNGAWIEPDGFEYPEVNGEALRGLSFTIGSNVSPDGFEPGQVKKSHWKKAKPAESAVPFHDE